MKKCSLCKELKPNGEFSAKSGYCRSCMAQYMKARYAADKERFKAEFRKRHNALKMEVQEAYGGKCACCGETEPMFLTMDHITGNGKAQRKSIGSGADVFYSWLKKQGFPKDNYQLLCFNCNCAKGHFGKCPHEAARRLVEVI